MSETGEVFTNLSSFFKLVIPLDQHALLFINIEQFNKLRGLKELGCLTGFEHSLGVYPLAGIDDFNVQTLNVAGLLHDVSHDPSEAECGFPPKILQGSSEWLRELKQLGELFFFQTCVTHLVYPGAVPSWFEHSLSEYSLAEESVKDVRSVEVFHSQESSRDNALIQERTRDCSVSILTLAAEAGIEAVKNCPCGAGTCLVLMAKTKRNHGRKFFKCPVRRVKDNCGFFEWCDESTGDHAYAQVITERGSRSGHQPKEENGGCGYSEWCDESSGDNASIQERARDYNISTSTPAIEEGSEVLRECACGLGSCLVLTANTKRNRGRKFFRCPAPQENGGCGFFEWCDESSGDNGPVQVITEWGSRSGHQPKKVPRIRGCGNCQVTFQEFVKLLRQKSFYQKCMYDQGYQLHMGWDTYQNVRWVRWNLNVVIRRIDWSMTRMYTESHFANSHFKEADLILRTPDDATAAEILKKNGVWMGSSF